MSFVNDGGPFLAAAVLCEKVLNEKDGVLSAIRIVDRFVQIASGPNPPEQMPSMDVSVTTLLIFKSGTARGNYRVDVTPVFPSQKRGLTSSLAMLLEGDDRGANIVGNLRFTTNEEGLYWIDIAVNDELVTRMPLRIVYQRIGTGSGGTPIH